MQIRLFHKLLAALVVASLASLVLFGALTHWYLGRNFLRFLNDERAAQLDILAEDLADLHRRDGGWDGLDDATWRALLHESRMQRRAQRAAARSDVTPPVPPEEAHPDRGSGPPVPRLHRNSLPEPTLYDLGQRIVVGATPYSSKLTLRAIEVDGRAVGWIGLPKIKRPATPREIRYARRQGELFAIAAAIVCVLSVLVAVFMARGLARPIQRISATTRSLTEGRYQSRVVVPGSDEIGTLATDVNLLARTLEENETARKRWIADISHELRTPLAIMQGEIEAVRDGVRTADQAFVDSLLEETARLTRLVEDLYQLARADIGALDYEFTRLSLGAVVTEALNRYAPRFADAGLAYGYDLNSELCLRGDKRRLLQMIENVLENCCRYVRAPGLVRVTLARGAHGADLLIEDSGPGVAPAELPRLFEPLARAEPSRSREFGGSGLGLAICRRIVEGHGGSIGAEPSAHGGLAIRITLPLLA
jgi:two-component system, OmpR family, sensor histidine kinase BaeS